MLSHLKSVCGLNLLLFFLLQQTMSSSANVRLTIERNAAIIRRLCFDQLALACVHFATLDSSLKRHPSIHEPTTYALNRIISQFNQQKQFNEAINAYQQGIKDGIPINIVTDTAIIQSYCGKGMTKKARRLFDRMQDKNIITLNTMITGYTDNKQFDKAIQLYNDPNYDILKDTITNTAIIKAYCKQGMTDTARQIFEIMDGKDTCTLNTMISGYTDNYQFDEAIQLYNDPNHGIPKNTITDTAAIKAYCKQGMTDTARQIFDRMREKNKITLTTMMSGYNNNKEFDKAIQLYNDPNYDILKDAITERAANQAYHGAKKHEKSKE